VYFNCIRYRPGRVTIKKYSRFPWSKRVLTVDLPHERHNGAVPGDASHY
jgi:hypothetical protein